MASKISAETVLASAASIEKVWTENPDMTFGKEGDPDNPKVTLADYTAAKEKVEGYLDQIETIRHQLTQLVDDKDDAAGKLNGMNTRSMSMIRGKFGPDSAEYDQAGGVRTSERKKPARSQTTSPKPA